MLIKLNYSEVRGARVKASKDGKSKSLIPLVVCDESNISDALVRFSLMGKPVPILYTGTPDILPHMVIDDSIVIIEREINEVDLSLSLDVAQIDSRVTIVYKLPDNFLNIKSVHDMCVKHENVRFVGGNLALIEGVRLGYVPLEDFTTKDLTKTPIVTNGVDGYIPMFEKQDFDTIEYTNKEKPVKIKTAPREKIEKIPKEPKEPKVKKEKVKKAPSLFAKYLWVA